MNAPPPADAGRASLPAGHRRLGLFLISALVDSVEVYRNRDADGRGLSVTMIKSLESLDDGMEAATN